jgi:hypothetical protein
MLLILAVFVSVDIIASLKLKRYLTQSNCSWPGAIFGYFYNTLIGVLYLHMAVDNKFLLLFDITELYAWLWPASFALCFFMAFFHCWAFPANFKE